MFTGIVEEVGSARAVEPGRLVIAAERVLDDLEVSHSICVNGACLTVTALDGASVQFDLVAETLARTSLGDLESGAKVNIERSIKIGDRLHGHFVQGHVDGVGRISKFDTGPEGGWMEIKTDSALTSQMIHKGSVGIEGISLTIAELNDDLFAIALIPHTLEATTLGGKSAGDRVNIEVDMLGKWVRRILHSKEN